MCDVPTNNVSSGDATGLLPGEAIVRNQSTIVKRNGKKMKWTKELFYDEMKKLMSGNIKLHEEKHATELTDDMKRKLLAAYAKGKEAAATKDEEDEEEKSGFKKISDLYIWRSSKATSEKVKEVVEDFNKNHSNKITYRMYDEDASLSRVFISGDRILRKQLRSKLEGVGLKKVLRK